MRDALGARGEALFYLLMTKFHGPAGPLFRPQFLGDKWPTVDFIVELERTQGCVPYFFVQVKTTRRGYTRRERRLLVRAEQSDIQRLAALPGPTYIVGIDEVQECGYLVSVNGENATGMSSLATSYRITDQIREALWQEVSAYWTAKPLPSLQSAFVDTAWR